MSGVNRLKIQEITQGRLRGKALADALAKELNSTEVPKINAKHSKG